MSGYEALSIAAFLIGGLLAMRMTLPGGLVLSIMSGVVSIMGNVAYHDALEGRPWTLLPMDAAATVNGVAAVFTVGTLLVVALKTYRRMRRPG